MRETSSMAGARDPRRTLPRPFAGSGALGLEALSRGAASCDFVDTSAAALRQIEHHLRLLVPGVPPAASRHPPWLSSRQALAFTISYSSTRRSVRTWLILFARNWTSRARWPPAVWPTWKRRCETRTPCASQVAPAQGKVAGEVSYRLLCGKGDLDTRKPAATGRGTTL